MIDVTKNRLIHGDCLEVMKHIPDKSIDLISMKSTSSRYERSDITAVPACSVIAESMLAWVIAKHFIVKFGGDSLEEMKDNYNSFTKNLHKRISQNFSK